MVGSKNKICFNGWDGLLRARIKDVLMVGSKDKGWLNEWEQGLMMVGWLEAGLRMVG